MNERDFEILEDLGWSGEHHPLGQWTHPTKLDQVAHSPLWAAVSSLSQDADQTSLVAFIEKLWTEQGDEPAFRKAHPPKEMLHGCLIQKSALASALFVKIVLQDERTPSTIPDEYHGTVRTLLCQRPTWLLKEIGQSLSKDDLNQWLFGLDQALYPNPPFVFQHLKSCRNHSLKDLQEIFHWFVEQGMDPLMTYRDENIFHHLAESGYGEEMLPLFDTIYELNQKIDESVEGVTPLLSMVRNGSSGYLMKWFLEHGANVNHQSEAGMTPILTVVNKARESDHFACETAHLLITHGADLTMKDVNGRGVMEGYFTNRPQLKAMVQEVYTAQAEQKTLQETLPKGSEVIRKNKI